MALKFHILHMATTTTKIMQMFSNAVWAQVYFCSVKSEIPSLLKGFGTFIGMLWKRLP